MPRGSPLAERPIRLLLGCCLAVTILLAGPPPLHAEPYLAVRTGFKCSVCHINQTGGGKRTEFGVIYSQTTLPMTVVRPADRSALLDGRLSDFVSVGGNFRVDDVTLFAYESSQGDRADASNELRISEANAYVQVDLIPNTLIFYVDQTLTPASANRELFGLLQNLPGNSYIKIGRMLLPYGLRMLDDEAFIRNWTGYTYDRHDLGAEVGLEPGPLSVVCNVTNTQLSLVGSVVRRHWRVGGTFGRETTRGGQRMHGAFGGVNAGRFTLLGETDWIVTGDTDRFAALAELSFLVRKGINSKAVYEFFDRNREVANERDGQSRLTLGLEPFLTQFLQVGLYYRLNDFVPQNVSQNQDQLVLQFHVFF